MNLSGWNFSGQNLSKAIIREATLDNSDLSGANLADADLSKSSFANVNFTDAKISGANFSHLQKDKLITYDMILSSAQILTEGQLYGTASYKNGDLSRVNFSMNNLSNFDLSGQNLTDAIFYATNLAGVNFTNANLTNADFTNSIMGRGLGTSSLEYTDFTNAVIQGANFSLYLVDFSSTMLAEKQLYSTASYKNRDLRGVNFNGNDLSSYNFFGQNLSGAIFTYANLENADFGRANLSGVDFRRAVSFKAANSAIYKNTIAPDGEILNFSMSSAEDSFSLRACVSRTGTARILSRISQADASISGGATLTIDGDMLEISGRRTLTVAEDGALELKIGFDRMYQSYISVDSLSGLLLEDGATLTVDIGSIDEILERVGYFSDCLSVELIGWEEDSSVSGLSELVKNETLFLVVGGENFSGEWGYSIDGNRFAIYAQVPEPATCAAIFGAAALSLAARRRRR